MKHGWICNECPEWGAFETPLEAENSGREHKDRRGHRVFALEMSDHQLQQQAEHDAWVMRRRQEEEDLKRQTPPSLFDAPVDEPPNSAAFPGPTDDVDQKRLTGQILRVWTAMSDGQWRTVNDICELTHDPAPSVLAQLGHLRKEKFGAYLVERRRVNESGLYEYRVGAKGAGVPGHFNCARCGELELEIVRLQRIIEGMRAHAS